MLDTETLQPILPILPACCTNFLNERTESSGIRTNLGVSYAKETLTSII